MGYNLDNIFHKILSEEITNTTFINQMLNEFYLFSDHSYFCMNIKICIHDVQNLTIIINLTKFKGSINDAMNKLTVLLRFSYLKAVVSNTFIDLSELKYNYLQARIALNIGRRSKPYKWIYYFDDIAPFYLVECCTKELPSNLVCSKYILVLINHDKEHDTDYYNTLKIYLKNNLNAVKSSNDLFIHRSTFLYRIQKIKELININFKDKKSLLYFEIYINILELSNLD